MKLALLLSGLFALSCIRPTIAANLLQIYDQARLHDAQFQAARQAYRVTLENRPLARASLLPQINFVADTGRNNTQYRGMAFNGQSIPNFSPSYDINNYTLSLRQTVFNYADWLSLKQADQTVLAAKAKLADANQALILRVATAYFHVLTARDQIHYSQAEQKALERQLEQAKKRFEVGLVSSAEVKQALASSDLARAQTLQAQSALADAREALTVITDEPVERLAPLARKIPLVTPLPDKIKSWVNMTLQQNLSLVATRTHLVAERIGVNRARAVGYPVVSLIATRSHQNIESGALESGDTTNNTITLQLKVPLFTGWRITAQRDRAQYRYQQGRFELTYLQRQIVSRTRADFLNILSTMSQVQALRAAVTSNEISVKAAEAGYRVGTRTSVDVITAIADLYRARKEYSQARYTYLLDTLKLKKDTGILTDSDLERINAYLARAAAH